MQDLLSRLHRCCGPHGGDRPSHFDDAAGVRFLRRFLRGGLPRLTVRSLCAGPLGTRLKVRNECPERLRTASLKPSIVNDLSPVSVLCETLQKQPPYSAASFADVGGDHDMQQFRPWALARYNASSADTIKDPAPDMLTDASAMPMLAVILNCASLLFSIRAAICLRIRSATYSCPREVRFR